MEKEKIEKKKQRQSNIELLRIIAISFVVILHYNNEKMGGGLLYADGINKVVLQILECASICAVDVFVISSGYFLCNTQKRTLSKPFFLLVQVIIMQQLCYFMGVLLNNVPFKATTVVSNFLPQNWFITLYIVLYFVSPYVNIVLNCLDEKKNKVFLGLVVFLFSIYPACLVAFECLTGKEFASMNTIESTAIPNGYSIINFVLLYIIGAFLRRCYNTKFSKISGLVIYSINVAVIFVLSVILPQIAFQYYSPFVILCAVSLFLVFKEMKFNNRIVNYVSKSTFTVFLLHFIVLQNINIQEFVQKNVGIMLLHIIFALMAVWAVCVVINEIYSLIINQIKKILSDSCIINKVYEV